MYFRILLRPSSLMLRCGNEDAKTRIFKLLGMLASVTDRAAAGNTAHLEFVLAVCVVAMLAGAKNYREIAGHAADLQPLLGKLGAEWSWFRLRYKYRANRPYGTC